MASSEATVNLTTAAKLKVLETLGEGGYSMVYKAEHVDWGPVAFKKLPVKFINDVIGLVFCVKLLMSGFRTAS